MKRAQEITVVRHFRADPEACAAAVKKLLQKKSAAMRNGARNDVREDQDATNIAGSSIPEPQR